jgi:type IV pilus assembly protein PilB
MLGVEPFLIANAINLIMAQRLVRKLCKECKQVIDEPDPNKLLRLGFTKAEISKTTFYRPVGCKNCYSGYKGRLAISEALLFNKEIRQEILRARNDIDEHSVRALAENHNMLSLRQSGKERIRLGLTSIDEIIAATIEN